MTNFKHKEILYHGCYILQISSFHQVTSGMSQVLDLALFKFTEITLSLKPRGLGPILRISEH